MDSIVFMLLPIILLASNQIFIVIIALVTYCFASRLTNKNRAYS
jgi:hypothetical protein